MSRLYDRLYLAAAVIEDDELAPADERFLRTVRRLGDRALTARIRSLEDPAS